MYTPQSEDGEEGGESPCIRILYNDDTSTVYPVHTTRHYASSVQFVAIGEQPKVQPGTEESLNTARWP